MPKNTSHQKKGNISKFLTSQKPKKAARQSTQSMDADDRELSQNKGKASGAVCLNNFYDSLLTVSHI